MFSCGWEPPTDETIPDARLTLGLARKNIVTAGVGITVDYAPNLAFYATYDGIMPTGNTTDHTVQAGLRIRF